MREARAGKAKQKLGQHYVGREKKKGGRGGLRRAAGTRGRHPLLLGLPRRRSGPPPPPSRRPLFSGGPPRARRCCRTASPTAGTLWPPSRTYKVFSAHAYAGAVSKKRAARGSRRRKPKAGSRGGRRAPGQACRRPSCAPLGGPADTTRRHGRTREGERRGDGEGGRGREGGRVGGRCQPHHVVRVRQEGEKKPKDGPQFPHETEGGRPT